jgi:hypothetical protein
VELDVTPSIDEPTEQALRLALAESWRPATPAESTWRRAALHEAVERDDAEDYAFSPRSTRGATRA